MGFIEEEGETCVNVLSLSLGSGITDAEVPVAKTGSVKRDV